MIVITVVQAGSVGTFFTVDIRESIIVGGAPVNHKVTASLNAVYVFDICDLNVIADVRDTPALNRTSVSPNPLRRQFTAFLTEEGLKCWTL